MSLCRVNGQPAEGVPVRDRGLAYGDGLFETIRVQAGQPKLFERHLQRLEHGVGRLRIPCDLDRLALEVRLFAAELGEGVAKLIVTRGIGERGYAPNAGAEPTRILLGSASPGYPAHYAQDGIGLYPCATRLAEQPLLAGLKHLNRLEQVMARAEWTDPAYAEGLMRDLGGRVIEGVFSNLFLVCEGRLLTADLSRCGVAGVMRAHIIEHAAPALGLPLEIRDLDYEELLAADEVFMCNSLYGIWPVHSLDARRWSPGAVTRKLQAVLADSTSDT